VQSRYKLAEFHRILAAGGLLQKGQLVSGQSLITFGQIKLPSNL
jgi:hypothetical protein